MLNINKIQMTQKSYKKFLESKKEEVVSELMEYFYDLEDEFNVDLKWYSFRSNEYSLKIETLDGFTIFDLEKVLNKIGESIKRMESIDKFTPFDRRNKKWGSIEGNGRVWLLFDEIDILDTNEMMCRLDRSEYFLFFYSKEARPISIFITFKEI